jgi:hypothetical protein
MSELFKLLGEMLKPEAITVKARMVVISHLSDAQENCYRSRNAEAVMRINFAKYIILRLGGDLNQEINPDEYWDEFQKSRIAEMQNELNR